MRRNWLIAAIVIGVLAIVIAALVMRLTEDEPPTTQEWANAVCTSLADWRESITSLADLGSEPLTADSLRADLSDAQDATSAFVSELRALGPPDLAAGDELEAELDDATAELESTFDTIEETIERAADAPASELLSELSSLPSDFGALLTAIGRTATTLQDADVAEESAAELQQAFADASSCQSLRAES